AGAAPAPAGGVAPTGAGAAPGRVVIEPVLHCVTRGIDPPCPACASGHTGACQRTAFGHIRPGLQTGYCADTGGGWSGSLVAHAAQVHSVPGAMDDESAVMVEPAACAVHAALSARVGDGETVAVLGAGTLGLCTTAALRHLALPGTLVVGARYPTQRRLAADLGADVVAGPDEMRRAVRRVTHSLAVGPAGGPGRLTGGADVVLDCVGSADSIADALAVVRPRGKIVLVGMPGSVTVDLAPLWQREVALVGTYAYGREERPQNPSGAGDSRTGTADSRAGAGGTHAGDTHAGAHPPARTFDLAFELVAAARLGRLVSARYPLERYREAVAHAAAAGRRGSVKIVFDLTVDSRPPRWRSAR
ncbi:MAG: zinc-dependent alcohol dehydrogenase, partial [Acidimicrobiales bacterium]